MNNASKRNKKEELLAYAHQCSVIRQLTPEERQQFGLQ
jgi:hypothetical protein